MVAYFMINSNGIANNSNIHSDDDDVNNNMTAGIRLILARKRQRLDPRPATNASMRSRRQSLPVISWNRLGRANLCPPPN